jgi:hypothetical protein
MFKITLIAFILLSILFNSAIGSTTTALSPTYSYQTTTDWQVYFFKTTKSYFYATLKLAADSVTINGYLYRDVTFADIQTEGYWAGIAFGNSMSGSEAIIFTRQSDKTVNCKDATTFQYGVKLISDSATTEFEIKTTPETDYLPLHKSLTKFTCVKKFASGSNYTTWYANQKDKFGIIGAWGRLSDTHAILKHSDRSSSSVFLSDGDGAGFSAIEQNNNNNFYLSLSLICGLFMLFI